jgi:hypothetical protein
MKGGWESEEGKKGVVRIRVIGIEDERRDLRKV